MGFSTERSAHNKVRRKKDKTEQKVKVRKQRTTYKTKNTARNSKTGAEIDQTTSPLTSQ